MTRYAQTGDRDAFRALFDRYAPSLAGYFRRHTAADDPSDLVQLTFLHLHRARADYRVGQPVKPWLFTIAANVGRDHARRRFRKPEHLVAEPVEVPRPAPEPPDPAVRRALDQLSERDREVVVLRWYGELGFGEIAEVFGSTEAAVKARAKRALEQLRVLLGVRDGGG
jgi:RNA polymerase sigma-70 factor, ECF subfamily